MNSPARTAALDATRLKQLRFVLAVAQCGSMAEAAQRLHMTASAASMLLRSVEATLGGRLFERTAHGMVPTARARSLIPRLRTILAETDALAAAAGAGTGLRPVVRIGVVPHVAVTVLPRVVSALVDHPAPRRVQLHEGRAAALAALLQDGELDFLLGKMAAGVSAASLARLEYRLLYQDGIAIVARKGHALGRRRRPVSLDELHAAQWVLPPAGSTTHAAFAQAWLGAGRTPPEPAVEAPSFFYGLGLVQGSDMLSCCARSAGAAHPQAITVLETPLRLDPIPVGLFWRAGSAVAEDVLPLLRPVFEAGAG